MATRRSTGTITKNSIDQASQALQQLPEKPKHRLSLKEAIAEMSEDIDIALNRGYSYEEVAGLLKQQGVEISASTLKSYLAQMKPSTRKRGGRKKKSEGEAIAPVEAPATAAKTTRKPRTQTAAKAQAKPSKTVAKPAPTTTTARGRGRKAK